MRQIAKMGEKPVTLAVRYAGDKLGADRMRLKHGVRVMREFERLTYFQRLTQNERTIRFDDGSWIHLQTRFGDRFATFYAPQPQEGTQQDAAFIPGLRPGFVAFNSAGERIGYLVSTAPSFAGPYVALGPYLPSALPTVSAYYTAGSENRLRQQLGYANIPEVGMTTVWEVDPAAVGAALSIATENEYITNYTEAAPEGWTGDQTFERYYRTWIKGPEDAEILPKLQSWQKDRKYLKSYTEDGDNHDWLHKDYTITGDYYNGSRDAWQDATNYAHLYGSRSGSSLSRSEEWHELNGEGVWHNKDVTVEYSGLVALDLDGTVQTLHQGQNARALNLGCRYYKAPRAETTAAVGFYSHGLGHGFEETDTAGFPTFVNALYWAEEIVSDTVEYFFSAGGLDIASFPYPSGEPVTMDGYAEGVLTKMDGYEIDGQEVYVDLLFVEASEAPAREATYGLFYLDPALKTEG